MTWKLPGMRLLIRLNAMFALWKQYQQGSSNVNDIRIRRESITSADLSRHYQQRELVDRNPRITYSTKKACAGYLEEWDRAAMGPICAVRYSGRRSGTVVEKPRPGVWNVHQARHDLVRSGTRS
jgi:hypothetical protein